MKKRISAVVSALLAFACAFSFVGCGGAQVLEKTANGLYALKKSGTGLRYYSSDEGFANFLNDYYSRHVRENTDKAIGNVQLGHGWMFQKEWESKYLSWFDSTASGIKGYDAMYNMKEGLDAVYVSDFGSVSAIPHMTIQTGTQTSGASHGWGFIYGMQTGNYLANFLEDDGGWTINGDADAGKFDGEGFWDYTFHGSVGERLVYEVGGLEESIRYAPMVEIAFKFQDLSAFGGMLANIKDINLSFKMADGEWTTFSYYEDAIYNVPLSGNGMMRAWFPVYLHPNWTGTLEGLKIEIIPNDGDKLDLKSSLNYVRLETDTRVTNANTWFIQAVEEYVSFTGDYELLERNLHDLRRAMMFQLYALNGVNGLLKTDYIWGKTTTLVGKNKFGLQGNSWYDVVPTGTVNLQANICFCQSLLAMAKLEEYAAQQGIDVGDTYVRNPYPYADGAEDILWTQTPESLRALFETTRLNVQKDVSDGGLWNEETGRFAWAIYDADSAGGDLGEPMDYGHTEINLMAVLYDVASETQKQSIMSWISGERIVEGDNSTGEDVYFYEYAPRINTKDAKKDSISVYKLRNFGLDVQNGGASMHVTFYDLLARNKVYGADNSFARFKEIQNWYEKVQGAGGKGAAFYRQYYSELLVEYGNAYKMTGGGQIGPIGLDEEFYEAALLYAAVPHTYFGLDGLGGGVLQIAPDLPSALEWFAMENLMFHNVRYDLYVTDSSAVISGVRGNTDGLTVRLKFKADTDKKVFVNYKETAEFTRENGYVVVEVPLGQTFVEIQ